jgi:N6-adenosine-specific RNA methylase IME4
VEKKLYKTILADNPWKYKNKKTGGSHKSGACQKYPVLSVEDLIKLPVRSMADPRGCVLLLWGTVPLAFEAHVVMAAWGFTYKTRLSWHKLGRKGTGYWFAGCMEDVLFGIMGKVPAWRSMIDNLFDAPVQKHSRKPEKIFNIIEPYIKHPAIELFATEQREGWDAMGYDIEHKDIRTVMAERGYTI